MDRIAECSQGWSFNLSISFHTIWWSLMALMFENKLKKDIFICFVLFRISVRFCIINCNYCAAAAGCRKTLTPVWLYHLVASQYPKLRWFCTFCTERKGHKNWATRKTMARLSPPLMFSFLIMLPCCSRNSVLCCSLCRAMGRQPTIATSSSSSPPPREWSHWMLFLRFPRLQCSRNSFDHRHSVITQLTETLRMTIQFLSSFAVWLLQLLRLLLLSSWYLQLINEFPISDDEEEDKKSSLTF